MFCLSRLLPLLALLLFPRRTPGPGGRGGRGRHHQPPGEQLLKRWTPQMLQSAADDEGDRMNC